MRASHTSSSPSFLAPLPLFSLSTPSSLPLPHALSLLTLLLAPALLALFPFLSPSLQSLQSLQSLLPATCMRVLLYRVTSILCLIYNEEPLWKESHVLGLP